MHNVPCPSFTASRPPPVAAGPGLRQRHAQELVRWLGEPLISGNRIELLTDDEASRAALFGAIEQARDHVNLECGACGEGEVGDELVQRLVERCRRGVRVNLLFDAQGAAPAPFVATLNQAGASVCQAHASQRWRAWASARLLPSAQRRRLLIVDGRLGIVGGCRPGDLHTSLQGPVLQRLQRLFIAHWQRHADVPMQHARYFPALAPAGTQRVGIAAWDSARTNPYGGALVGAVEAARSSVALTIADALPERALYDALCAAADRGIAVELLLPRVAAAPPWLSAHAVQRRIERLVAAGVQVLRRDDAPRLRADAGVIDGVWAGIGCARLGWRNMLQHAAADLVVLDEDFAALLLRLLRDDVHGAVRVEPADAPAWRRWTASLSRRFAALL